MIHQQRLFKTKMQICAAMKISWLEMFSFDVSTATNQGRFTRWAHYFYPLPPASNQSP